MKKIDYKKILDRLINEYPHDVDKIEKIVNDARNSKENFSYLTISFKDIITNKDWTSDEKARLLRIFDYNVREIEMDIIDEYKVTRPVYAYLHTIKHDNLSGFEALMKIHKEVKHDRYGEYISNDESYREIFSAVIRECKPEKKSTYLKTILNTLTTDEIKGLIETYYTGPFINAIENLGIFNHIISSNDLNLIKEYIGYIDDINIYLSKAVETGNIEIVKFFLKNGADINYLSDEVILGSLTPLKTAINNNDYEMVKFLIENGVDFNLQVNCDDFMNQLKNYIINVYDRHGRIKKFGESTEPEAIESLKYLRGASPLEHATKLSKKGYKREICYNIFGVYFEGQAYTSNNNLKVNMYSLSKEVINRGKIVDLIFDKIEDKTSINYNDLIGFTFVTRDIEKFNKYVQHAIDNKFPVDFDRLFELYFQFHIQDEKDMLTPFLDFLSKYDKEGNVYLKLMNYYINSEMKPHVVPKFYIDKFNKAVLQKIPEEKRKNIYLVPYCKDINTLEELLSLGFDINQTTETGNNILLYLLCNRSRTDELNEDEMELFNYLLENLDLSTKDNNNKTPLYYAMQKFDTKDEYLYTSKDQIGTRTNLETAVAALINKMDKDDVCNDDIKMVLEERLEYCSNYGEKIHLEYVYQHHKELFDALIEKGFKLSDKILSDIFKSVYPKDENRKETLPEKIDMNSTLDYIYQNLDSNTEIQELDIEKEFNELVVAIDSRQDTTFDEFLEKITNFNNQITDLNMFYENNIKEKFNPEKYLEYAKERYNTTYNNLDDYLTLIIIRALNKYGTEKLADILDTIPNYDINHRVANKDVGLNYWNYVAQVNSVVDIDDDGYPIYDDTRFEAENVITNRYNDTIEFSGGLMQYAILTDNLPMVKQLQEKGAELTFYTDNGEETENHTWDYVNSQAMQDYMEIFVGNRTYSNLSDQEKQYYLKLVTENNQTDTE